MAGYIGGSSPVAMITDSVDTTAIADNAVTSAKIGVDVIVAEDIASNAITVAELADNAVTNAKLADDAVDSAEIAAGAVDLAHMSVNSIDSAQYVDGSIDLAHLSASGLASSKFLKGDNTWATVDALPSQGGNSGKFLTTDATNASWAVLNTDSNTTTKSLYEMANAIAANYTIATNYNAISAGPITVNNGVSVTVPSGSTWVVV